MITWSSNQAACALIVRLHRLGAIGALNADLRSLGLATMQVTGTRASNGANWQDGALNMTALDTARLFWLIDGGRGTLWHRPDGRAVTAGELKPGSRAFLKRLLGQDAFADTLSTTVWCGQRRNWVAMQLSGCGPKAISGSTSPSSGESRLQVSKQPVAADAAQYASLLGAIGYLGSLSARIATL